MQYRRLETCRLRFRGPDKIKYLAVYTHIQYIYTYVHTCPYIYIYMGIYLQAYRTDLFVFRSVRAIV